MLAMRRWILDGYDSLTTADSLRHIQESNRLHRQQTPEVERKPSPAMLLPRPPGMSADDPLIGTVYR